MGISIATEKLEEEIVPAVDRLLADKQFSRDAMRKLKEEYIYHNGASGKVGAKYIIDRLVMRSGS